MCAREKNKKIVGYVGCGARGAYALNEAPSNYHVKLSNNNKNNENTTMVGFRDVRTTQITKYNINLKRCEPVAKHLIYIK